MFTLDEGAHDRQTVNIIASEFDGIVEVRTEDGRQVRGRGFGDGSSDWVDR